MEENAAKWLHVYKLRSGLRNWSDFVATVEENFGVYDYMQAIHDLLRLRHEGTVKEYTRDFETV
jgi:hypothetical protein